MDRRCAALKRDGTPCRLQAQPDSDKCWAHNPANAEKRREITSNAGSLRSGKEIAKIKKDIRRIIDGVGDGTVERGRASVMFQGFGVLRNFVETERKQHEAEVLEERITELERAHEERNTSPRARGGVSRW